MKPTFFNSAKVRVLRALVERASPQPWEWTDLRVRWALFEHPLHGLIALDTGYTPEVTSEAKRSLPLRVYAGLLRPRLCPEGQIGAVLEQMGAKAEDVKLVILSHYHADHISGLRQFSQARFIAPAQGAGAGLRHGVFDTLLPSDFEPRKTAIESCAKVIWRNKTCYDLLGDESLLAVPLGGHSNAHFGFWFAAENLLYAVDTEWTRPALHPEKTPRLAAWLVTEDRKAAAESRAFVQAFAEEGGYLVLCHDPARTPWDAA